MSQSFLSAEETRTLEAVCDALVPSVPPLDGGDDAGGLMARSASDLEVARLVVVGSSARTSVADPYGQVHGVAGLYVADASGFPTASGVNPMLSVMALAYRVAQLMKAG